MFEILFVSVWVLFSIIGSSYYRERDSAATLWWSLFVFIGLEAFLNSSSWTFSTFSDKNLIGSAAKNFLIFIIVGACYSALEFYLELRKLPVIYATRWNQFMDKSQGYGRNDLKNKNILADNQNILRTAIDEMIIKGAQAALRSLIAQFNSIENYNKTNLICADLNATYEVIPKINKGALADRAVHWTLFWPFFLVTLVINNIMVEFFNLISTFITGLFGRLVKKMFVGVFKI